MNVKCDIGGGLDTYIKDLEQYKDNIEEISRRAIYEGADVLADEIRKSIERLNTSDGRVTDYEKEGLLEGLGIARMRKNGTIIDAKIGMDGYNHHPTKKYPKGQPNAMIARSIEKGTSFRRPQPFISNTVERCRAQAENAMSAEFDRQTGHIMK